MLNKPLRFLGRSSIVALFLACLTGYALVQGNTADLQGVVTDPSGATVSGARVRLENPSVGLVRETTSRETGEYSFLSRLVKKLKRSESPSFIASSFLPTDLFHLV